ncbi:MAG: PilZ domain-containing protein [Marinobacterium sp.]|nr:PilZ domain-containing protein [Marinobacterium sp.]
MSLIIPESLDKSNKRKAVRVELSAKDPVRFAAAGQKTVIDNISESGIAFRVETAIEESVVDGILKFKIDQVYTLRMKVEILTQHEGSYRARFLDLSKQNTKLMSRLVLGLQKLHIRRRKQQKLIQMEKMMAETSEKNKISLTRK